jgi:integrase/recombinase XerD
MIRKPIVRVCEIGWRTKGEKVKLGVLVRYGKQRKIISLDEWVHPGYLDGSAQDIPEKVKREYRKMVGKYEARIEAILSNLGKNFSIQKFDELFRGNYNPNMTFSEFVEYIAKSTEKNRTATSYRTAHNALAKFMGVDQIEFTDITRPVLVDFRSRLIDSGKTGSTVHKYLRTIRTLLNKAIEENLIQLNYNTHPFGPGSKILHGLNQTTHTEALSIPEKDAILIFNVDRIKDKHHRKSVQLGKYYFQFMYFSGGMDLADLINLKWPNVMHGELNYVRTKTERSGAYGARGQRINMKLHSKAQEVIDKIGDASGEYVFPWMNRWDGAGNRRKNRIEEKAAKEVNEYLRFLSFHAGVRYFTSKEIRHTVAYVLQESGLDLSVISSTLGHADANTTKAYLKKLTQRHRIDEAINAL